MVNSPNKTGKIFQTDETADKKAWYKHFKGLQRYKHFEEPTIYCKIK